jgi:hypothetical protein
VFHDVPVNDITDTLTVSIQSVNRRNVTAAANAGYIKISPLEADGYTKDGWNIDGYGKDGYTKYGWDRAGYDKDGYDLAGYNKAGYDRAGYNKDGYNKDGYDRFGYDRDGFNKAGRNKMGLTRKEAEKAARKREKAAAWRPSMRSMGWNASSIGGAIIVGIIVLSSLIVTLVAFSQ